MRNSLDPTERGAVEHSASKRVQSKQTKAPDIILLLVNVSISQVSRNFLVIN